MSRLVFISSQYPPNIVGGAEITVQALVEELSRRGELVEVISLSATDGDSVDRVNGITVHRLAAANLYQPFAGTRSAPLRAAWHLVDIYNLAMARKVRRILDRCRPDWVSLHNLGGFSSSVWDAARASGARVVQTIHDYYLMCPKTTMFKHGNVCASQCFSCKAYSAPKKILSNKVDVAIGVSQFALSRLADHGYFPRAKLGVVHNGRSWREHQPRLLRKRDDPLVVGFIGRVAREKGIEVLLAAVEQLADERVHVRVAGKVSDAAYQRHLEMSFRLPRVEYLGFVPADAFYPTVDVMVIPSIWEEPLGMVAVEPLGYAIPVITSDIGGLSEIVPREQGGWLVKPSDVQALSERLRVVLEQEYDAGAMRKSALVRRRYFTPERQADQFLAMLG